VYPTASKTGYSAKSYTPGEGHIDTLTHTYTQYSTSTAPHYYYYTATTTTDYASTTTLLLILNYDDDDFDTSTTHLVSSYKPPLECIFGYSPFLRRWDTVRYEILRGCRYSLQRELQLQQEYSLQLAARIRVDTAGYSGIQRDTVDLLQNG